MSRKGCWCGSKKPYEECHKGFDIKLKALKEKGYFVPPKKCIKNEYEIEGIREASRINSGLLDYIEANIKEGMSTDDINDLTNEYLKKNNATSADLGYMGYPKSICTSPNNVVCHGVPSKDVILKSGDIINVDATTCYKGFYGDASRMFLIGDVSDEAKRLVKVTKECLYEGIKAIKPWESTIADIGKAIEKYAHLNGYSVVEEYTGHGVGLKMHEDPYVYHFDPHEPTYVIVPGMTFTIEPMINEGKRYIYISKKDGWTSYTLDGKLSAQWEHTLLVTEDGVEILSM